MRLPDVYIDELDSVAELMIQVSETHGPLDEGWSSRTAEDESYGLVPSIAGQSDGAFPAAFVQREIGSRIT
jgi:hypothetical protein